MSLHSLILSSAWWICCWNSILNFSMKSLHYSASEFVFLFMTSIIFLKFCFVHVLFSRFYFVVYLCFLTAHWASLHRLFLISLSDMQISISLLLDPGVLFFFLWWCHLSLIFWNFALLRSSHLWKLSLPFVFTDWLQGKKGLHLSAQLVILVGF